MSLKDYHQAVDYFSRVNRQVVDIQRAFDEHVSKKPVAPPKRDFGTREGTTIQKEVERTIFDVEIRKRFGQYVPSEKSIEKVRVELQGRIRRQVLASIRTNKANGEDDEVSTKDRYKIALAQWRSVEESLSDELSKARQELLDARELAGLFFDEEVWRSLPDLEDASLGTDLYFRGTLGSRLLFDGSSNAPRLVAMDSFVGESNFVEFSPDISVARSFALHGFSSDVKDRWDAVVVATKLARNSLNSGHAHFVSPKLTIDVDHLLYHCTSRVFRVSPLK